MKHFFANFIAMFFISKKARRHIRAKIMGKNEQKIHEEFLLNTLNLINEKQNELTIKENHLLRLENEVSEKQKKVNDLEQKYDYLQLKAEWLAHNNGQLLLPGRFDEYDLVFGIGATCITPEMLNYFHLRRFSNPFDWTAGMAPDCWHQKPDVHRDTRFHEKIYAICDKFKDWLNPAYFKYVNSLCPQEKPYHHVVNIKTKVRYLHEFPANQDIMQHWPEFIEKSQRRIKNLYTAINKSNRILIVWLSSIGDQRTILEQNVSDTDIKWAVKQMQKLYPNKLFDFVFFEHDGTKDRFEYEKTEVASGAFRIKSNHFLIDPQYNFVYQVQKPERQHTHVISEMLDNIHLSKDAFKLPEKTFQEEIVKI